MRATDIWEKRALTPVLDEATILRQIWGNSPKDPDIRSQQDLYSWLDKEIVKVGNRFYQLVRELGFCNNLTPEIKEKLHDMVEGLVDTDKSIQSGQNQKQSGLLSGIVD